MFYTQSDPVYISLKSGLDVESDEDLTDVKLSISTLLMRAFSLNAWSFVTFILLVILIGKWS